MARERKTAEKQEEPQAPAEPAGPRFRVVCRERGRAIYPGSAGLNREEAERLARELVVPGRVEEIGEPASESEEALVRGAEELSVDLSGVRSSRPGVK